MVHLRTAIRSPLLSFAAGLLGLLAFGLFSSEEGPGPQHAAAEAPESSMLAHSLREFTAKRALPEERPAPRVLFEPGEDAPPGLPIALEDLNGRSMEHFHKALDRAKRGEGKARLVFYGASHTAADLFTGVLRESLQERYGDGGPGFVLPVHPWRSYRHHQLTIESNGDEWKTHRISAPPNVLDHYGLAGAAMEASEIGSYGRIVSRTRGLGSQIGRFELFYMNQPEGGSFEVLIDDESVGIVSTRADERSAGFAEFTVPEGPHRFEIRIVKEGPVRIFGVAAESEGPGVVLDTLGINGSRVRNHLLWEENLYRLHLSKREPDLVVLAYGTNESGDDQPLSQYEAELHQVLARIRETVPEASCLLIGPSDRPVPLDRERTAFEDRPRTHELIEIQWRASMMHGCAFFDMVAFQGGPLSMVAWNELDPPYAAPDHIHFRRRGYERFGEILLGALLENAPGEEAPTPLEGDEIRHAKSSVEDKRGEE